MTPLVEPNSKFLDELDGLLSEAMSNYQVDGYYHRASWYGNMLRAVRALRFQVLAYQEQILRMDEERDLEDDELVEEQLLKGT